MSSLKQKLIATTAALPLAAGLASAAKLFDIGDAVFVQTVRAACNPCAVDKATGKPSQKAVNELIFCLSTAEDVDECLAEFAKKRGGSPSSTAATCNPCAATKTACNPCAVAKATCKPCATAKAACNPCAATKTACKPCAANKAACNPCSIDNPCAVAIPEVESAMSVDEIIAALKAPPKQSVGMIYSLDEIKKDFDLRNLFQAVEVKSVGFGFDSADVMGLQAKYLGDIGAALRKILDDRPDEVFLIEGHADAPGPDAYNLHLSKQRALQIKSALVNVFGIPEKNVIAAGFGEKYLKIDTGRPEMSNRRVTVRCITPLVRADKATE